MELYLDGKLIAKQKPDNTSVKANLGHPSFTFYTNWKAGKLKAIGYNNGLKIMEHTRTKQGKSHHIKIDFNITDLPFYAGGSDLRLVHASVLDENGEVITNATNKVQFSISGNGELVDNGKIDVNPAILYNGVASIYIKGTENSGKITITAKSKGLKSSTATINTVPFLTDEIQNS
ncbi:hypothetical protein UMM65_16795 [Aureibaculum sp. 2210JD6-5]|uniref:DUF4982 domain-containing protein n=1 Tax=Aureibaculum sp. 2210JD6-5 TaxID=3103957 RepID=UPI002AAE487D|nr:DUF4982 domain-containing protein [Aureibaculum sp. 2210JD6-5]MDY7396906.1 hypothetical protein [Aureibaculum sp. 2210JD6-5]